MEKISKAGVYDIPAEIYHGDCCISPSLSASGAVEIIEECPRMFWHNSYLNPNREREEKDCFDIGTVAHMAMLEPHLLTEKVAVIEYSSYRTKDAQEMRDDARACGKIPMLEEQFKEIQAMRKELFSHPIASKAFAKGNPEQSLIWKDEKSGVWCKSRPDWTPESGSYLIDYKTSATANPEKFIKQSSSLGYHQKAAWQLEAAQIVTGKRPRSFYFVVQSTKSPYLVSVFELDATAILWGEIANAKAREIFSKCLKESYWPGYCPPGKDREASFELRLPAWAEKELEKRDEMGAFAIGAHVQS